MFHQTALNPATYLHRWRKLTLRFLWCFSHPLKGHVVFRQVNTHLSNKRYGLTESQLLHRSHGEVFFIAVHLPIILACEDVYRSTAQYVHFCWSLSLMANIFTISKTSASPLCSDSDYTVGNQLKLGKAAASQNMKAKLDWLRSWNYIAVSCSQPCTVCIRAATFNWTTDFYY